MHTAFAMSLVSSSRSYGLRSALINAAPNFFGEYRTWQLAANWANVCIRPSYRFSSASQTSATPDPDKYESLFDPQDGTVCIRACLPTAPRPGARHMTLSGRVLEFRFDIAEWAEHGDTVFVEAAQRRQVRRSS